MNHSVADHPMRKEISDMILSGVSLRKIAQTVTPTVSPMALQRYKAHILTPALQKVAIAKAAESKTVQVVAEVTPFVERMYQHADTVDAHVKALKVGKDGRTAAALIAADVKAQELAMRAMGLLDAPGSGATHITCQQVVMLPQPQRARVVDVQCEPQEPGE